MPWSALGTSGTDAGGVAGFCRVTMADGSTLQASKVRQGARVLCNPTTGETAEVLAVVAGRGGGGTARDGIEVIQSNVDGQGCKTPDQSAPGCFMD